MAGSKNLKILCLDGGGFRGLSSLLMLQKVFNTFKYELEPPQPDLRPCEFFDLIAGTSTGGIIALMLGRLRMSIEHCIAAYSVLGADVFGEQQGFPHKELFDTGKLERAVRSIVKREALDENAPLLDPLGDKCCKVAVYTLNGFNVNPVEPEILRTYRVKGEPDTLTPPWMVWEAARATSAAPTFFKPLTRGTGPRLAKWHDAGLGYNNPGYVVRNEAARIWGKFGKMDWQKEIRLFLSLGTGVPRILRMDSNGLVAQLSAKFQKPAHLVDVMKGIITDTETVAANLSDEFSSRHEPRSYFRFNVEQGLSAVDLFDYEKEEQIRVDTNSYLSSRKAKVIACASTMVDLYDQKTADWPMMLHNQAIFTLLYPRDKKFVGRQSLFDQIEDRLMTDHCVSLLGIGGIGKSQIAIEYAYRTRDRFPQRHIFWVYAANATRFDQSYREIARHLKLDGYDDPKADTARLVYEWLNGDNHAEWLMIVDNADDADLFMHQSGQGSATDEAETAPIEPLSNRVPRRLDSRKLLITTTRNRSVGQDLANGEQCLEVGPFSVEEAQDLLRSKAGCLVDQSDELKSKELMEGLGCIPLAITQAAAFMVRNAFKVEQYLSELEKDQRTRMDILSTDLQDTRRELRAPNSVFRTWSLSFEQIRKQAPRAAQLLSLMAMLDPERIPEGLLREQGEKKVDFVMATGTLMDYSLIVKEVGEEIYAMHPLVQLSVQYWLEREGRMAHFAGRALQVLAKKFPIGKYENRSLCEELLPHARALLKHSINVKDDEQCRAELLYNVGGYDWRQGRYDLAYENVLAAYNARCEALGTEDRSTLNSASMLGTVLGYQGKYEAAEMMNRRALAGREKALGVEHPGTLTSVGNLASVLQHQGKYGAAETMYRRALAGYEKALGAEHPDTLTSVGNLALVLQYQGNYGAAEMMNRRALAGSEKALGAEHPGTLTSVGNLALVLQHQGHYEAAEVMNRRALADREKALGAEHPDTLTNVGNLALVLQHQGKYGAAETMNRRALAGREKILGAEHPDTLTSVSNLSLVLQHQGKYGAAETMYRRALAGCEKALGTEHPDTLTSVGNLASVLQHQGKYEAAETMNRRSLAGYDKALGAEHPNTLTSVSNLASVLQDQGKYGAAEMMNRRALAGSEKALGAEHPNTLTSVSNLASVLQDQGKYGAAEAMNRRALAGREKALGTEHPSTLISVYCLAYLFHIQHRFAEAEELYWRALNGYERVLGVGHPTTAACRRKYSALLREVDGGSG